MSPQRVFDPHADRGTHFPLHGDKAQRADLRDDHFLVPARVLAIVVHFLHEKAVVGADAVGRAIGKRNVLFIVLQQHADPIRLPVGVRIGNQADIERDVLAQGQLLGLVVRERSRQRQGKHLQLRGNRPGHVGHFAGGDCQHRVAKLLAQRFDLLRRAAHDSCPAVGKLVSAAGIAVHRLGAGDRCFDVIDGITRMSHVDPRDRRLQRMRGLVEEQGEGPVLLGDLQHLDLGIGRRVADRADEISEPIAHRDANGTLFLFDRLGDQLEDPLGEPAAVGKISGNDLNRSGVIMRAEQDQVFRRQPQLVPAPLAEDRRGHVQAVQVIRHKDQAASAVAQGQDAGVDVMILMGRLGAHHRRQLFPVVRRDDAFRHARLHHDGRPGFRVGDCPARATQRESCDHDDRGNLPVHGVTPQRRRLFRLNAND